MEGQAVPAEAEEWSATSVKNLENSLMLFGDRRWVLQEADAAHLGPVDVDGCLQLEDSLVVLERVVEGSVDAHLVEVASENYPEVALNDPDCQGPKSRKNSLEMAV